MDYAQRIEESHTAVAEANAHNTLLWTNPVSGPLRRLIHDELLMAFRFSLKKLFSTPNLDVLTKEITTTLKRAGYSAECHTNHGGFPSIHVRTSGREFNAIIYPRLPFGFREM